jgi:hypothetical protein
MFLLEGLRIVGAGSNFGWPSPALVQNWGSLVARNCHLESFRVAGATVTDCRLLGAGGNEAYGSSVIERCLFEECSSWFGASGLVVNGGVVVRDCTFLRCEGGGFAPVVGYADYATPVVEGNLFQDCEGPCVGPAQWPPVRPDAGRRGAPGGFVVVRRNTFVGNEHGPLGPYPQDPAYPFLSGTFEGNIVTGSALGVWLPEGVTYTLLCNDSFGNGSNWTGFPDPTGVGGNFSADPLFCDPDGGDFTLSSQSPCLPGNHPDGADCGLIGALGKGCGTVGVEAETWAGIKSRYRGSRGVGP